MVREQHPLPELSRVDDAIDPRRVRALLVSLLESDTGRVVPPYHGRCTSRDV